MISADVNPNLRKAEISADVKPNLRQAGVDI